MTMDEVVVGRPEARPRPFADHYLGYRETAPVPLPSARTGRGRDAPAG